MQNNQITINRESVNWIDWMKTIAMFLIILGHLSPYYLKDFIYAFSVPSFFVISGFLFKNQQWSKFWSKNIRGLIIPYSLLSLTIILFFTIVKLYFGGFELIYFPLSIFACLIGDQNGIESDIGCQALWFVYTLFLSKITANIIRDRWIIEIMISLLFLSIAFLLNQYGVKVYSSYVNLFVCYPFFTIGYFFKKFNNGVLVFVKRSKNIYIMLTIIIGIYAIYIAGYYNGMVQMFNCGYGNNIWLFLLGGVSGTFVLLIVSMLLDAKDYRGIAGLTVRVQLSSLLGR